MGSALLASVCRPRRWPAAAALQRSVARALAGLLLALLGLLGAAAVQAQSLESVLSPGPLVKGHVKVEHQCDQCHVRFDRAAQDGLCLKCHKDVALDLQQRQGWHGRQKPQACRNCHTDHRGRDAKVVEFDPRRFDHRQTDFELRHAHAQVDCGKCHTGGRRWREASNECHVCHRAKDVHRGGLGSQCADCHNERKWTEVRFDHDKKTRFALAGKHLDTPCDSCHRNGRYKDLARTCVACHKQDDDHKGHYGDKCENCHGVKAWKPSSFRHDDDTPYVLRGKHRSTRCNDCHTTPLYRGKLSQSCVDCHKRDDKHEGSLGKDCASCHSERGWKEPARFDHEQTRFPLLGGHQKVECKQCHRDALYRQTPRDCAGCHKKDDKHNGTLGSACADCHIERDWKTVTGRFDHERTRFPLRQAHASPKLRCEACHRDPRSFRDTGRDCHSCHAKDDKHEGTLGRQCESCHTERDWKVARFDHSRTRFALLGRHVAASCKACHETARFKDAPEDCLSCHRKDDKHKQRFGANCQDCHNARAWSLWDYDHARRANYPLDGAHRRVPCEQCHTQTAPPGKAAAALGSTCAACHQRVDVHEGSFGPRCDQCHTTDTWKQIRRRGAQAGMPAVASSVQPTHLVVRTHGDGMNQQPPQQARQLALAGKEQP